MRSPTRLARPRRVRRLSAGVLLAALSATACSASPDHVEGVDTSGVVLVVIGDSLTAGSRPLAGGEIEGEGSWVPSAVGDPLLLGGGWAVPGATTADMRSGVRHVDGDVLVVMAGTNDVGAGVDWTASRDNLLAITRTLRIGEVIVSAIPPSAAHAESVTAYNDRLRQVATEQGWVFTDPWAGVAQDGRWVAGASSDGVHPTQEVADEVGCSIRTTVLARADGG
ncbi:SGNH/GDSL hydrolase family protein [Geodermatophilus sp. SYSU D00700]